MNEKQFRKKDSVGFPIHTVTMRDGHNSTTQDAEMCESVTSLRHASPANEIFPEKGQLLISDPLS